MRGDEQVLGRTFEALLFPWVPCCDVGQRGIKRRRLWQQHRFPFNGKILACFTCLETGVKHKGIRTSCETVRKKILETKKYTPMPREDRQKHMCVESEKMRRTRPTIRNCRGWQKWLCRWLRTRREVTMCANQWTKWDYIFLERKGVKNLALTSRPLH